MHDSEIELNEQADNPFWERQLEPKHLHEEPHNPNKVLKDHLITAIKSLKSAQQLVSEIVNLRNEYTRW